MEDIDAPHELSQEFADATSYAEVWLDQLAEIKRELKQIDALRKERA